tara:strand:- start:512 stop:1108 length:597 start_codon:yes stop_codon:yes gene_type:complete
MTMREDDNNNADATRAALSVPTKSIGHDNARDKIKNSWYYINNEGATTPRPSRKDTQKMANSEIFIATAADMTLAFSSIGPAFTFIQDSHADLNPEGAVLMLAGAPATASDVKASYRRTLDFTAAGADGASRVAAAQSALDGALQACQLVGVDPANVSKVAELQVELDNARMLVDAPADAVVLTIERMTLHKRGYKRS